MEKIADKAKSSKCKSFYLIKIDQPFLFVSVSETRNSGVTLTHPTEFYLSRMQIEICQLSDILVHSCDADKMKIKNNLGI